jgi:anti-sigma regulatory factor (Ser/Thr protein kinase)
MKPDDTIRGQFEHRALFYEGAEDYIAGCREFIEAGLAADERVLVSVPGAKIEPMRAALNGGSDEVEFWNMNDVGHNPGRIIPAVRDWVDRGTGRCRFIGEPHWPGRSATEVIEATRHEALINLAFADADAAILCPYDVTGLERDVVLDAERTHPDLISCGHGYASERYTDPLELWWAGDRAMPGPSQLVMSRAIDYGLGSIRELTARAARDAGLAEERSHDFVVAVDEAATNALVHGRAPAQLRMWREPHELICEIADCGCLTEPLAGRRRPRPHWTHGRGVWMMNQLCDLVELRPTADGTVVRLHVCLEGERQPSTASP